MPSVFLTHNPEDLEVYFGRSLEPLRALATVRLNPRGRDLSTPELIDAARGCEVIVAHRATPGEAALFNNSPELVAFLRTAVDIRDVDVAAASANGVLVARAGPSFVPSTAEMALGLMLAAARDIARATGAYQAGDAPDSHMGRQLRGSTAGIIGYGRIGSYLAEVLVALGMQVLVTDPYRTVAADGIEAVEMSDLLARSDFVLPLATATPETENLIGADELARMKPTAVLVNVSRGNLLDEAAVEAAYREGRIGGLAMDVGRAADQRPSPRMARLPGVVATPHLGGLTPENADAQAASAVEQVAALGRREMPPRAVNPDQASRLRRLGIPG